VQGSNWLVWATPSMGVQLALRGLLLNAEAKGAFLPQKKRKEKNACGDRYRL